jgi:hypothetical protein
MQNLDHRCIFSVEERNKAIQAQVGAYRCLPWPKRDTEDRFSWIFPAG